MSLSTNLGMQDLMKGHYSVFERFDNAPAKVALKHLYIANPCKSNSQTSLSENVLMIIIQYVDRKKHQHDEFPTGCCNKSSRWSPWVPGSQQQLRTSDIIRGSSARKASLGETKDTKWMDV